MALAFAATPMLHRPSHCRYCKTPLSGLLQMRGDVCSAAACRLRAAGALLTSQREVAIGTLRQRALQQGITAPVARAPVVWLRAHPTLLIDVGEEDRAAHAAHLFALAELGEERGAEGARRGAARV